MVCTRPDLSYTVTKLAQYNEPNKDNWIAVKRVLRYIKGTITKGLKFTKCNDSKLSLVGYSDASWASDLESRRSVTGFVSHLIRLVALSRGYRNVSQLYHYLAQRLNMLL